MICKFGKTMSLNFFIKLKFLTKSLKVMYYKNYIYKKNIKIKKL